MPRIGAHFHVANPLAEATAIGADAAQFFLGDPQGWKGPVIPGGDPAAIRDAYAAADVDIYIHAPYVINVATSNNRIRIPSRKLLDQQLKAAAMMDSYMVYMHNELQIMVAQGNPKKIAGVQDLARPDVRTSMPNSVNEGIMQFYIRKVLERRGIWQTISGGKECVHCQSTDNNWFTAVHHRETPARIVANQSDAGMVWKTEVLAALRGGAAVEAVALPDQDSLRNEVSYAIGMLAGSKHRESAEAFLNFLRSPDGQDAYAKFGFVRASDAELQTRPIP